MDQRWPVAPQVAQLYVYNTFRQAQKCGKYSGGLKTELGKLNAIPIPNILMFWFRMVLFLNGLSEAKRSDFEWQLAWTI